MKIIPHKLNENFPSTNFVGGIFPRNHVSIIAAKAGVGKTWYILKLLTDLSKGGTIFNNQAYYEPARKCLLFVGETGMGLLAERSRNMHDKPNYDNLLMFSAMDAKEHGEDLSLDRNFSGMLMLCKELNPDVIVFDTMMSFRSGDESDMVASQAIMENLSTLSRATNSAVIVTHHMRKSSKQEVLDNVSQDEIIGSSAIVRLCGNAFVLQKLGIQTYSLTPVKAWWELPPKIMYRMIRMDDGQIYFEEAELTVNYTNRRLEAEEYYKASNFQATGTELISKFSITKGQYDYLVKKYKNASNAS